MAITTLDGVIAAMPGQRKVYFKGAFTPQAAGQYYATWLVAGQPSASVAPSSGIAGNIPTDTDANFVFTNPVSGKTYLGRVAITSNVSGTLLIYDRLWHNSGINATLTTAQTVNSVALDRPDANGVDAEAWWQTYATMGAGAPTITLSYTDSDNNAGNTATAQGIVTTMTAGRTGPFALAAGDKGVKSIQSYTQSVTMTSGTIGLVLRRLIASVPVTAAAVGTTLDAIALGMPEIPNDACLEFLWLCSATTAATIQGEFSLIQG